jgi:hypothetical protein
MILVHQYTHSMTSESCRDNESQHEIKNPKVIPEDSGPDEAVATERLARNTKEREILEEEIAENNMDIRLNKYIYKIQQFAKTIPEL